ncbi:MAG: DUF3160 domain-containing protein [bacterium]|nr:DUF3160 domain-containing protein [bacterium]
MLSRKIPLWLVLIVTGIALIGVGALVKFKPSLTRPLVEEVEKAVTWPGKEPEPPKIATAQKFASYVEAELNVSPNVPKYEIKSDLSNVTNASDGSFWFSDSRKELLAKNGFVVAPGWEDEFFSIYERNRYAKTPNFITTDSMLHHYHLAFDYLLRDLETNKLRTELIKLASGMLSASQNQLASLSGGEWEQAAKRNLAYFSVVQKLLDPSFAVPAAVKPEVAAELALIESHQEPLLSPVMNLGQGAVNPLDGYKEDYSQYVPRGHYTKTEELKTYFKTMMYLGRMTFRLKSAEETKSAVLIVAALKSSSDLYTTWEKIYEPTVFFVGKSDDLTLYQYDEVREKTYGKLTDAKGLSADAAKLTTFITEAGKLEAPQINSMPIFGPTIQADREKEIKGFRFMGQRFTLDASVFQRLVYREVGDKQSTCAAGPQKWAMCPNSRCLPKALDIPAAMGSAEALKILTDQGETKYACYSENMTKMRKYIAGLSEPVWTQNLYWGWLYTLNPLTTPKGTGWPTFMQSAAWQRKDLTTYLGSWTELKHDTILYAKQVYAELGGGPPEEKDDRGYVEPNLELYTRLEALLQMTRSGLTSRNLLSSENEEFLSRLQTLSARLKEISGKELSSQSLSSDDYELIRGYGGSLEHLWIDSLKDKGITDTSKLDQNPASLVADVATDPNGSVLEEGTGKVADIYVVVPVEGKLKIAKGGVFLHYEFAWPMSDRLTDEKWNEMLRDSKAPPLAEWVKSYVANE